MPGWKRAWKSRATPTRSCATRTTTTRAPTLSSKSARPSTRASDAGVAMLDLGRTFLQSVERRPERLAIVDGDVRLSYGDWHARIRRVAGGLAVAGLARGDHLVVVMQNRWEMATLHWACQFLGVVVTPLNWRAKADEVDYCAGDADARAVVFEPVSAVAVDEAQRLRR